MNKIEAIKQLLDQLDYPVLFEIVDCVHWCHDGDSFMWADNDSNIYSAESREGYVIWESHTIGNGDTCCGPWVTYCFHNDKELDMEDFEEKYEEYL